MYIHDLFYLSFCLSDSVSICMYMYFLFHAYEVFRAMHMRCA